MNIFIDPAYKVYYNNELFNRHNEVLNRDDCLTPYIRMRDALKEKNIQVQTTDYLMSNPDTHLAGDYYSFGVLDNLEAVANRKNIHLKAFIVLEPPVVAPHLYKALPQLTSLFETVYLYNAEGDGYSLKGVNTDKIKKFYCPQPYNTVTDSHWNKKDRKRRVVVINGNHKPRSAPGELYSQRIKVMSELGALDFVDLYGRNWTKWWSRESMWVPYWKNRNALLSIYNGSCSSKSEVLSQYDFSLCFENMYMNGHITEKIFDCFYAGTVPVYWGAKDMDKYIPENAYVDFRNFKNSTELKNYLMNMTSTELNAYKDAARDFLQQPEFMKYYDSIRIIVEGNSLKELA